MQFGKGLVLPLNPAETSKSLESASNYCIETVQTGCDSGEQRQINEHATRMGTLETADKEADGYNSK